MNLQENIRRIIREQSEDFNTTIEEYDDGFDVFIMDEDKKIGEISFAKEPTQTCFPEVHSTPTFRLCWCGVWFGGVCGWVSRFSRRTAGCARVPVTQVPNVPAWPASGPAPWSKRRGRFSDLPARGVSHPLRRAPRDASEGFGTAGTWTQ